MNFCKTYKNDYLVLVQTTVSDILGYADVGISSTRSTFKKCRVFSSILVFIHFKLILESCTASEVYLEPKQTSMLQKRSIVDIWQGFKYGSAASFFNIFPLSSFGYWNEFMSISFFFLKVCRYYTHVTYVKNVIRYSIGFQTTCFIWNYHRITNYSYIHAIEMR